jgi:hypothetical protein
MHPGNGRWRSQDILERGGMTYIEELEEVIRRLHGVESTHRESVPVKEVFQGSTIGEGVVEVFDLHGHPKANTAYAWAHQTDDPARSVRHVTVLQVPLVVSPITAVRAAIVQELQELRANAEAEPTEEA